jgi:hypothetical protein
MSQRTYQRKVKFEKTCLKCRKTFTSKIGGCGFGICGRCKKENRLIEDVEGRYEVGER